MSKGSRVPDSYCISHMLVKVIVVVLCLLFVVWAVRFVPPVIHIAF